MHGLTEELASILHPLVGGPPLSEIHSTFMEQAKSIQLQQGECMPSFDVKVLFTSMPVGHALDIICNKLKQDTLLHNRISLSVQNIVTFLEFCHKSTFFMFQGKYYWQVQGTAMGSPISLVTGQPVYEGLWSRALSTSPDPPRIWLRYVDNTFIVHKAEHTL